MKTGEIVKPVTARRLGSLSLAATKPVWRRTPLRGARTADDNRTTTTIKPKRPHWGGESPAPSGRLSMSAAAKRGLGQKRTLSHSFDYSVGGYEQTGRDGETKSFRGFYVDGGFVFGRRLYRKVSGFVTAQDAV